MIGAVEVFDAETTTDLDLLAETVRFSEALSVYSAVSITESVSDAVRLERVTDIVDVSVISCVGVCALRQTPTRHAATRSAHKR